MNGNEIGVGLVMVMIVAGAVVGVIRLAGWAVLRRRDPVFSPADEVFALARLLYGSDTWAQLIVSKTNDGYLATAHNQARTLAVSSKRFGRTAEEAIRLLCLNLRRMIDSRLDGKPEQANMVH